MHLSSFIVSSPELIANETYTVFIGGSSTSSPVNGLYETGGYRNDGNEEGTVTLADTVSFIGEGGMGGFGGNGHGQSGVRPDEDFVRGDHKRDDREIPDGEMPDFKGNGGFREDRQPPTDENGNFAMPDDWGERFDGGKGGFVPDGEMQIS